MKRTKGTVAGVWILIADPERRRRWEKLLERFGWQIDTGGAESLRASPASAALVLIDAPPARLPDPPPSLLRVRPGAVCVLAASAFPLPNETVVKLLETGADDYFHESMDERLIQAKIAAHLRRMIPAITPALDTLSAASGDIRLDRRSRRVAIKSGKTSWREIDGLTPTEFMLLWLMVERLGAILERNMLLETIWGDRAERVGQGTVDKHVESLRRKLGADGRRIRTIYGSGYLFSGDSTS